MNLNQNRQELFRDVFRIKTGHRDLIFDYKNKHKLDHLSEKLKVISYLLLDLVYYKGRYCQRAITSFKSCNNSIANWTGTVWFYKDASPNDLISLVKPNWSKPVKNRNHLYLILRDYILLSKSLQDGIYSDSAVVNESCDFFLKRIVRILIKEDKVKSDYLGKIERCEKFNLYTKSVLTCSDSDSDSD